MKKIVFSSSLTGAEILERNPNKKGLGMDTIYNYVEGVKVFGEKTVTDGGVIECEITRIKTQEEINNEAIQKEIIQLQETIAKKKLRDMDYTAELERLNEIDPIE